MRWWMAILEGYKAYKEMRIKQKSASEELDLEDRVRVTSETADEYNEQLRTQAK